MLVVWFVSVSVSELYVRCTKFVGVFFSHYLCITISKSYQFKLSDFLFCCYFDWVNVVVNSERLHKHCIHTHTNEPKHTNAVARTENWDRGQEMMVRRLRAMASLKSHIKHRWHVWVPTNFPNVRSTKDATNLYIYTQFLVSARKTLWNVTK